MKNLTDEGVNRGLVRALIDSDWVNVEKFDKELNRRLNKYYDRRDRRCRNLKIKD